MTAIRTVAQNALLVASLGIAFFWSQNSNLSDLSLQFISFVVIVFFITQFLGEKSEFLKNNKSTIDFILLTLVVFLIIFSTGGLLSPVFFLVYFLLFAVSLLFEPTAALSLATISSIFLLLNPRKELFSELLQLSSLFLISPLALAFGSQYIKILQNNEKIRVLADEGKVLEEKVMIQEQEVHQWTSQKLSRMLTQIQTRIKILLSDPNIPQKEKDNLKSIFTDIYNVFVSGKEMEKKL